MDYDFSGLCADQLFMLEKRLSSLNKKFIQEYRFALNIINDKDTNDNRGEIMTEVEDALRDVVGKSQIFYTEAVNKIQRSLSKHL